MCNKKGATLEATPFKKTLNDYENIQIYYFKLNIN